jgi:parallel beta-helix repeat protein
MATVTLTAQNGPDQASQIQAAINSLNPGDTLLFSPGYYAHSTSLTVPVAGVTLTGYGANLAASTADDQSIIMSGTNSTIVGFVITGIGSTRLTAINSTKIQITGNGIQALANTINGGAGAGIFNFGGQNIAIYGNTVSATLADGIHNTYGANNVLIQGNTVTKTGDDMISVVSYQGDGTMCSNVLIIGNNVSNNPWGRGIAVVGGSNVTITGNAVSDVQTAAGIIVAQEDSYTTFSSSEVLITNNQISNIQTGKPSNATLQGAIELVTGSGTVACVEVTDNTITNSEYAGIRALTNVAFVRISGNAFSNLAFLGAPVTIAQSAGQGPIIVSGSNTLDGAPLVPPPWGIASGPLCVVGAVAQLMPQIRASVMQL